MGQQLCSSPTIGFLNNEDEDNETNDKLIEKLINNLEKNYIPKFY